jgi:hypothetical protein
MDKHVNRGQTRDHGNCFDKLAAVSIIVSIATSSRIVELAISWKRCLSDQSTLKYSLIKGGTVDVHRLRKLDCPRLTLADRLQSADFVLKRSVNTKMKGVLTAPE